MSASSPMRTRRRSGGRRPAGLDRRTRASLLERLRADARRIAHHFGLHYAALEAENARVKRRYGSCHEDGRIKIRIEGREIDMRISTVPTMHGESVVMRILVSISEEGQLGKLIATVLRFCGGKHFVAREAAGVVAREGDRSIAHSPDL